MREMTPNDQGKLEIDPYGHLAGVLSPDRPLESERPSVQQVYLLFDAPHLQP